jgi:predicted dehydrogenase
MSHSNSHIGVGIVGLSAAGGWASAAHVPALKALAKDYSIVALAASSPLSAKAASERFDIPFHTDSAFELASRPDVDLVVITVKVPFHRELVEAAVSAGKMVCCEWPLGNGLAETKDLTQLVAERGVRNFVGLQARSSPTLRYLRDLYREGYMGKLLSTTLVASAGPPWGGIAPAHALYSTDKTTGASMLTIPFGHAIDALTWMLGDVTRITSTTAIRHPAVTVIGSNNIAHASVADHVAVTGLLDNGAVLSMHYRGDTRTQPLRWEINGTECDIVVTGDSGHMQFSTLNISVARGQSSAIEELTVPQRYTLVAPENSPYSNNVAHAYYNILEDLRRGTDHVPRFSDAARLHTLLDRIEASSQ